MHPLSHPIPAAAGQMTTLARLAVGEAGVIAAVDPAGAQPDAALRLLEMGFFEGARVDVRHVAPLGADPLVVQVDATCVALRRAMAELVVVNTAAPPA